MKAQRTLVVSGSRRRVFVYAGMVALFCLAMPFTTLNANGTPDATGMVNCKVNYPDGTSANIQYPVGYFLSDGTVIDRWGAGYDVRYSQRAVGFTSPDDTNFTLYLYSLSDPDNPATFEKLYSETGKLNFRVDKNRKMQIDGKSFVVMDTNFDGTEWISLTAECSWKLSGLFPIF